MGVVIHASGVGGLGTGAWRQNIPAQISGILPKNPGKNVITHPKRVLRRMRRTRGKDPPNVLQIVEEKLNRSRKKWERMMHEVSLIARKSVLFPLLHRHPDTACRAQSPLATSRWSSVHPYVCEAVRDPSLHSFGV